MKKILFSSASIALLLMGLASCSETKESKTETSTTETTVTTTEKPASESMPASDAPVFSNDEVNQNLAQFRSLKEEYIKALETKDPTKISDFATRYSTWAKGAAAWGAKLKPEEMQAFSDYMTKLNKEWTEAAMKAVTQ